MFSFMRSIIVGIIMKKEREFFYRFIAKLHFFISVNFLNESYNKGGTYSTIFTILYMMHAVVSGIPTSPTI